MPVILRRFYTLFIVMISFVIFSSNTLSDIFNNIFGLFNINNKLFDAYSLYILKSNLVLIVFSIIFTTPLIKNLIERVDNNKLCHNLINILEPIVLLCLLLVSTSYIIDGSYNPFLYFRF